jgi:hypothetical protein
LTVPSRYWKPRSKPIARVLYLVHCTLCSLLLGGRASSPSSWRHRDPFETLRLEQQTHQRPSAFLYLRQGHTNVSGQVCKGAQAYGAIRLFRKAGGAIRMQLRAGLVNTTMPGSLNQGRGLKQQDSVDAPPALCASAARFAGEPPWWRQVFRLGAPRLVSNLGGNHHHHFGMF